MHLITRGSKEMFVSLKQPSTAGHDKPNTKHEAVQY